MTSPALNVAVLISGRGSNLKAMIDAIACNRLNMRILRVISNRADAAGIAHAQAAGIPVSVISHKTYPERQFHDAAINQVLENARVELIILAGYMRILTEVFTRKFEGRVINLHPSLLPLYKGLDTYNRALKAGDSETGASIHFVTTGLDAGPIIAQVRIPIKKTDDAMSLSTRLAPQEHRLLVATLEIFCQKKIRLEAGHVFHADQRLEKPLQLRADGRLIKHTG